MRCKRLCHKGLTGRFLKGLGGWRWGEQSFVLTCWYLEKAMAPHSSTLAWKIPWTEEPGRLQYMGSLGVRYDWATSLTLFTFMHWRRKWQPTPVFLPGESQGRGCLVGCHLWGCIESDTTEATQQQQQLILAVFLECEHGDWLSIHWLFQQSSWSYALNLKLEKWALENCRGDRLKQGLKTVRLDLDCLYISFLYRRSK